MSEASVTHVKQNLTFCLNEELFAINIEQTLEVLEMTRITRIPRMPDFLLGVINLRGNVIPVVNLRNKFGMPEIERSVNTCIIIVEIMADGEKTIIGVLVDSVNEVYDLDPDSIEAAPKIGTSLDTAFIQGVGKCRDDGLIMILNIDKVFSSDEIETMSKVNENQ